MKLPKHIRGAVFDLDGTLLDSLGAWSAVDRAFFSRRGIEMPCDYMNAIKAFDLPEAAHYTRSRFSLPDPPEALITEWLGLIREEYALRVDMKQNAREYLFSLAARGVKLAVATSSSPEVFSAALERHGVAGLFGALVTTQEVGCGKQSPAVYLEAARRLGLSPSGCAVFEDIPAGIKSARSAGFYTVAVYDPHGAEEEPLLRRLADDYWTQFPKEG